ncbi:MAG: LptF/LptG family permease [Phycisphaerae bacterium]|nr:LptF/LptG family permease [Phycisphaerae bacterium]
MSILDRYIARTLLANILALLVILFCFIVAVDLSWNFNSFRSAASAMAGSGEARPGVVRVTLVTLLLVFDFWWPKLLNLYNVTIGLVLVGAMGFTLAAMSRHRELIAILAGGRSLFRVARPIVLVGLLAVLVQGVNQELVIPRIAPLILRSHDTLGQRSLGASRVPLAADSAGRVFYAEKFDPDRGTLEGLTVLERDARGLTTRRVTAAAARWSGNAWELEDGRAQVRLNGRATVEAASRVATDLDPTALTLRRFAKFRHSLSWSQISRLIDRPEVLGDATPDGVRRQIEQLERVRWSRIAIMLCTILTLLITLPLFLRREPGNMVLQSIKCAPVAVAGLIGSVVAATALGIPGLPPQLSAFVPVLVLLPIGIAAITGIRT